MKGRLLRVLGAGFGLAVIVGATIGGEILKLPGAVAAALPSRGLYLAAWASGGLYALLCAGSFAELGTRIPRSGGLTTFADAGLGPFAGFVVGWGDFLASAFTVSAYAMVVGELGTGLGLPGSPRAWAMGAVGLLALLQGPGVRWGSLFQDGTSLLKGLLLLVLAAGGLALAPIAPSPAPAPTLGLLPFLGAMQLVIFAYDNYYGAVYFGEEYQDPARQVPRALFGGVAIVTGVYVALAWGMAQGLPREVLTNAALPGAELGRRLGGVAGWKAVEGLMLLSLLSAMNATCLIASRVLYALGSEGLAGRHAADVNEGGTPTTGLAVTLVLAFAGLLLPSFEKAIEFMSPFVLVNYGLCFLSLLALRRQEPEAPGIFRVPGFPWTTGLSLAGSGLLLAGALAKAPKLAGGSLAMLALAWPLYHAVRRAHRA